MLLDYLPLWQAAQPPYVPPPPPPATVSSGGQGQGYSNPMGILFTPPAEIPIRRCKCRTARRPSKWCAIHCAAAARQQAEDELLLLLE